jgi:hypothetical protein
MQIYVIPLILLPQNEESSKSEDGFRSPHFLVERALSLPGFLNAQYVHIWSEEFPRKKLFVYLFQNVFKQSLFMPYFSYLSSRASTGGFAAWECGGL